MSEDLFNPIHPGKTLQRTLEHHLMSQKDAALRLGMTEKQISMIVQGRAPITPKTANLLEFLLGVSAGFWNNLQKNYDEKVARLEFNQKTADQLKLVEQYTCYEELAKWDYVAETTDPRERFTNLLEFFGVTSLDLVPQIHGNMYRKSEKPNENTYSLAAWLRIGDIEAQKIVTADFSHEKLSSSIEALRGLTLKSPNDYGRLVQELCAECGIAVVYTPYFKNTNVNGASRWVSPTKALVQLSMRFKTSDVLWFTLFHEIGHLLKHGKKEEFVEFTGAGHNESKEQEADKFASESLIAPAKYNAFVQAGDFSRAAIKGFAHFVGIGTDIVAGRLAHDKHITWPVRSLYAIKIDMKKD